MPENLPFSPPRLTVELSEDLNDSLNRLIPWGTKSQIFRILCEDLVVMLEKNPEATLGAILSRNLKLHDFPAFKLDG